MQSWRDVQKDFWLCDQDDVQICVSLCYKRWGRVPLVRASLCPSPACFEPSRPQYLAVRPPKAFPWGQSSFENTQTNTRQPREEPQAVKSNWLSWKRENKLSDAGNTIEFGDQLLLKCFSTSYSRTGWRWRQNMRSRPKLSVDQLLELTANVGGGALAAPARTQRFCSGWFWPRLVLQPWPKSRGNSRWTSWFLDCDVTEMMPDRSQWFMWNCNRHH